MTQPTIQLTRDPEFERFLGAAVGEDPTGKNVTVLSMLARLDIDPWIEASDLTAMPEAPARKRLEALLERFNDVQTLMSDQGRVAAMLLTYLPRRASVAQPSLQGTAAKSAVPSFGAPVYWIIATGIVLLWILLLAKGN